jgi:hypothetical protein
MASDSITTNADPRRANWIEDQLGELSEGELRLVEAVLNEIKERRADGTTDTIEHFPHGTMVRLLGWADTEFVVQGTAPWRDQHDIWRRRVEIRSRDGAFSGHVDPSALSRVA